MKKRSLTKPAITLGLFGILLSAVCCSQPVSTGDTGWRVVGAAGQPAFQNSWSNYGSGYANAAFRVDGNGYVHLRGTVQGGAASTVIFTLPAGYRTSSNLMIVVYGGAVNSSIAVFTDGTVICGTQFNTFVCLDNVVFHAD